MLYSLLFLILPLFSPFVNLTVDNGLSNNSVWCISQDDQGYMWFGTKDGLNRYDGTHFRNYSNIPGDSLSLGNDFVRSLLLSDNQLLVGTDEGLYAYNRTHDSFNSKFTSQSKRIQGSINSMAKDSKGDVWLAARGEGIYYYSYKKDSLYLYSENQYSELREVWSIVVDTKDRVWFLTIDGYIGRIKNKDTLEIDSFPNSNIQFNALYYDPYKDCLWLGSLYDGVYMYDIESKRFSQILTNYNGERIRNIHSIFEYSPGLVMIACDNGLIELKRSGEIDMLDCTEYTSPDNSSVFCIYKDYENGLWLGTYYYGALYLRPNHHAIKHFYSSSQIQDRKNNIISCFAYHKKNQVWVGSNNHGIGLFDIENEKLIPINLDLKSKNIKAILEDEGKLWVAYYNDGVDLIDLKTARRLEVDPRLAGRLAYSFCKSRTGLVYIGTQNGLLIYDTHSRKLSEAQWAGAARIYDIKEDMLGTIWLASFGEGLISYTPSNGRVERFTKSSGLPSSKIVSIAFDFNNNVWCGTEKGVFCLDVISHRVDSYNMSSAIYLEPNNTEIHAIKDNQNLITNNKIHCILLDDKGLVWASTNYGLYSIDAKNAKIEAYYKSEGLQSNQFMASSGYKTTAGSLIFGGINGFNIINPDLLKVKNTIEPKVVLNSTSPISCETKEVRLNYNQREITLNMAVLSYKSPQKNVCSYFMDGVDKQWNHSAGPCEIRYKLAPGKYTFKYTGSNADGVESGKIRQVKIMVSPHPLASTPMIILYVIAFLSIVYTILYLLYKHFQNKNEKIAYDSKISFFTNIVHEIRTPLSLIKAPLEQVMETANPESRENLLSIERNAQHLINLVNQLLDFRKMGDDSYDYRFDQYDICQIVKQCCDRFTASCALKGINFSFSIPDSQCIMYVDSEAIEKLVNNILSNAVKFTKDKIELNLKVTKDEAKIEICNNGAPIDEKYAGQIFKPFFQIKDASSVNKDGTGIGLALCKCIVDKHKGGIEHFCDSDGITHFVISMPILSSPPETAVSTRRFPLHRKKNDSGQSELDIQSSMHMTEHSFDTNAELGQKQATYTTGQSCLLFVDDNKELAEFIKGNLGAHYKVLTAQNGLEAWRIIEQEVVDVVVSDIMMAGMDGLELCRRIKSRGETCHIPVVLLSAQTGEEYKTKGLESGCDAFMEKPFSVKVIRLQIDSLLRNRSAIRRSYTESPLLPVHSMIRNKEDEGFVATLNAIILDNLTTAEGLQELIAQKMSMSVSNLRRKIKSISGMPAGEYVLMIRLKKAAELINTTNYRINGIAYMVGFNTPSYFSKCFYEQYKVLPKDYAKKQ